MPGITGFTETSIETHLKKIKFIKYKEAVSKDKASLYKSFHIDQF